ncbi:MAG: PSD1 and planctomycete cytochrome C domain-containing protein [Planctomycetaceae bacterium]|nr:PSD1 and planctomycete cytochrome C domain-containing protein [Planctomycetaceae bacterium]
MTSCIRVALTFSVLALADTGSAQEVQFNRDVRPILSENCFACHGFDAKTRQAELRLDVPDGAFAAKDGIAAITPRELAKSAVWLRITSNDPDQIMPPPASHKTLNPAEIATIKRWIEQGATYQKHWAFEPVRSPSEPNVKQTAWTRNPIDRFLLARMESTGLTPNRDAPKSTLIRRVAFALTGLPPTLEEVAKYEADPSPTAYENMVQRYLDSPHFGEEMARHWLDVARYADTHGLHLDNEREMWAYRDWVVDAFNRNLPFDQFTVEQLAGDLLPNPTKDQLIATGFNRCNVTTSEGGSIAEEFLYRYAVERTSTTVQAWMGLTAGCAVCHDHKFDPISAKEFYSLYAFFYSAADPAMDKNIRDTDPFLSLATPEQETQLAKLKAAEQVAKKSLDDAVAAAASDSPSEKRTITDVWLDDVFPPAQKLTTTSRNKATWVTAADGLKIPSGLRALRQAGAGMYQDRIETIGVPLVISENAKLEWWVRIDQFEPPTSVMLELSTSRGARRVMLGDAEKLGSGTVGTPERLRLRDLPPGGEWTALAVTAEQLDLKPGDIVRSLVFAQYGGIVDWDGLRITGDLAPNDDPRASFPQWRQVAKGQDVTGAPAKLQALLKAGLKSEPANDAAVSAIEVANSAEQLKLADDIAALEQFWRTNIARPTTAAWTTARRELDDVIAARTAFEDRIPGTFVFKDMPQPRDAFVMQRGQYDKPGDKVEPATPAVLPPLKPAGPRPNRLDLAQWLVAPEQPLTARVAVNRVWQQLFGMGLVKTSDDFGSQGEPPSHPELLDWLAAWYRDRGWDTKELVRLMVLSSAFRQAAAVTPDELAADSANRLYARGPRFRLDAEQIRDNALFVSGLIDLRRGGPGVKPYQPPNIWEPVGYADSNTRFYLQDHGDKLYRRTLYCFLKRTAPPPFMSNFDGPNREQLCARRERSNTPLQALQLLNDVQHVEAARAFAERMLKEGGSSPTERIAFAYRTTLSRSPSDDEAAIVTRTLQKYLDRYREDPAAARQLIHVGESSPMTVAEVSELAAYTLVANLVLNLDETVTRN